MGQGKKERSKKRKEMKTLKAQQLSEMQAEKQNQDIEMIISQSDSSLTVEQATSLYQQYECDVVKVLTHLWDPVKAEEPVPGVQIIDRDDIPEEGTVLDETGKVVALDNTETATTNEDDDVTVSENIEDESSEVRRQKGVDKINRLRQIADQKDNIFCQFQEDYQKKKRQQQESTQSPSSENLENDVHTPEEIVLD